MSDSHEGVTKTEYVTREHLEKEYGMCNMKSALVYFQDLMEEWLNG